MILEMEMHIVASLSFFLNVMAIPISDAPPACPTTGIEPVRAEQVRASFTSSGNIPTVVPEIKPTTDLEAVYPNGKAVDLGTIFNNIGKFPIPFHSMTLTVSDMDLVGGLCVCA